MISSTLEIASLDELIQIIEQREASPEIIIEAIQLLRSQLADRERSELGAVTGAEAGGWDWTPGSKEMNWSPYLSSLLGYAHVDLPPRVATFNSLLHPDDARLFWVSINRHLRERLTLHDVEIRLRHKDGSYRWINSRGKVIRDITGEPVRVAGLHLNITPRKNVQEDEVHRHDDGPPPVLLVDAVSPALHCKRCGSNEAALSRWQSRDWILSGFLLRALRCRTCGHRFYRPLWMHAPTE